MNYEEKLKEELELVRCDLHNAYSILEGRNEEIERLNNIINKAKKFLKNIGYDEEIGRVWNDMNDDECTELLKILEGGRE